MLVPRPMRKNGLVNFLGYTEKLIEHCNAGHLSTSLYLGLCETVVYSYLS